MNCGAIRLQKQLLVEKKFFNISDFLTTTESGKIMAILKNSTNFVWDPTFLRVIHAVLESNTDYITNLTLKRLPFFF